MNSIFDSSQMFLAVTLSEFNLCKLPCFRAALLDEEKSTAAVFQPVPFHYLEIAKVLFAEAKDCFGADMLKVSVIV